MLSEGWNTVKLRDILERVSRPVELNPEDVYQEIGVRSHGRGVFHKEPVMGAAIGEKRVFWVAENALVLNIVFAWEQAVALTSDRDRGFIASHRFPMYRPREQKCDLRFLFHNFQSPRGKELLELASPGGAGRNRTLGQNAFESISITCPPLSEQIRIADILQVWDDAICVTTELWAKQKEEAELVRETLLEPVLKHVRVPLSDVATVRTGLAKGKTGQRDVVEVPYLRVANVQDGRLDLKEVKRIEVAREHVDRYSLQAGDVLMTEGGDFDKLGRGTVWVGEISPCLHQNHVFAVRPKPGRVHPGFIAAIAASDHGRSYFLSCAKRSTNLASINSTQLKALPVPLVPMAEQERIVAVVDTAMQVAHGTREMVDRLVQEKAALMADLLTGKRRVGLEREGVAA